MTRGLPRLAALRAGCALAWLCAPVACHVSDGELGRVGGSGGRLSCALASPLVQVRGHHTCTGRLAGSLLSNALCTCGDMKVASSLVTDGFDSRQGPYQPGRPGNGGASVGVNGTYSLTGSGDIRGSFSIAGPSDVTLAFAFGVSGDLWAAGNVSSVGVIKVARNAWLAGNYSGLGPLFVTGDLHHAGTVVAQPLTAGSNLPGAVTVPKPCPCEPGDLLDIGGIVQAARVENDNAILGLAPDRFAALTGGASQSWTLPCGRAYLTGIGGTGNLNVGVNGMSAIFIDGSLDLTGNLIFDIKPGAELDVFVKDNAKVIGKFVLATMDRPAAGRIWVGGSQPIGPIPSPFVGTLYAPNALVTAAVGLDVWGAIFAGAFSSDFSATFIYDRSILGAGSTCNAAQPAAGECRQCGTCSGGSACVSGMCGACVTDADCCSLSTCANGSCVPWISVQTAAAPGILNGMHEDGGNLGDTGLPP